MKVLERHRLPLPADHPAFGDHFPGQPVAPGALLLALAFAELKRHGLPAPRRLSRVKFHRPARPGMALYLSGQASGSAGEIAVAIVDADGGEILTLRYRG